MAELTRTDKATLISIGQASEAFARIVALGILSRTMTLAAYGTFNQVWLVYFTLIPFFYLGLDPAIYSFWPQVGTTGRKEMVLQSLFLHTVSGLAFSAVMFFGAAPIAWAWGNAEIATPLRVFSLYPLLALPALASQAVLMSADRPALAAVMGFVNRAIPSIVCVIALTLLESSLTVTFLFVVIVAAALLVVAGYVTIRPTAGSPLRWRWRGVLDQIKFSVPMGTSAIVTTFSQRIGQLAVSFFYRREPERFAIYRNGAIELPVFPILTTSANMVILPEMSARAAEGRHDLMIDVWHRAIRKVAFLILPAAVFLLAYARETVLILFSSTYAESVPIFIIFLCLLPTQIANFATPLMLAKKAKAVAVSSAVALIALFALSIGLIPVLSLFGKQYGLWGPPIGAVISRVVVTVYCLAMIHVHLRVPYSVILPWRYLAQVVGVSLVATVAALAVKLLGWPLVPRFLAGGVAFCLVFGVLSLAARIFPELERDRLKRLWRTITRR
jgi:O-antigen/teichoic acid export membrane protein